MTTTWQREAVQSAVSYLRDLVAAGAEGATIEVLRDLREVLDPRLRAERLRREAELDAMDAHGEGLAQHPDGIRDASPS